jgi:hypothetical protein
MNTLGQWVHQHDLLLVGAAVITVTGLLLVLRRPNLRWWLAWFGMTAACSFIFATLRTPATSLYVHAENAALSNSSAAEGGILDMVGYSEPDLGSIEAIESALAQSEKPTLIEIYSDFGLS